MKGRWLHMDQMGKDYYEKDTFRETFGDSLYITEEVCGNAPDFDWLYLAQCLPAFDYTSMDAVMGEWETHYQRYRRELHARPYDELRISAFDELDKSIACAKAKLFARMYIQHGESNATDNS